MDKQTPLICKQCQYCVQNGRMEAQGGRFGRKKYMCEHPNAPSWPFIGFGEMSLNFYRAVLNAGATKEEAFVLLQSFISASIHGDKEKSDED